jgi:hypothetical protein
MELAKSVLPGRHDFFEEDLILLIEPSLQTGSEGIGLGLIRRTGVAHQGLGEGWPQGYPIPGISSLLAFKGRSR